MRRKNRNFSCKKGFSIRSIEWAEPDIKSRLCAKHFLRKDVKDNWIVSPLSISTGLAMLQAGARGETAETIRTALHFPPDEELNTSYQSILQQLHSDGNVTLEMVNRVYPTEGFLLNPEFSSTLKSYFGAEPQQLNYARNVEAAGKINSFVNQSTQGKISELIQASSVNERTKLVLTSAIYFKGNWKYQFPKKDTTKMRFYTSETASVEVDMMKLETDLLYKEFPELDTKAVALPYAGNRWDMIVVIPNKRNGLTNMENMFQSLSADNIERFQKRRVQVFFPKFKLESSLNLEKYLNQLVAGVSFDGKRADFSGISATTMDKLFVSWAIHKVVVEVDEEGNEEAAATDVSDPVSASPEPLKFVVDHPFYSVIVHHMELKINGTRPVLIGLPVIIQRVVHI